MAPELSSSELIEQMVTKANKRQDALLRLKNWNRVIRWMVDDDQVFWKTDTGTITVSPPQEAQITITCSKETLKRIASQELPFFLALWATGDLEFKVKTARDNDHHIACHRGREPGPCGRTLRL